MLLGSRTLVAALQLQLLWGQSNKADYMKYQIRHLTRYCYQHPVANSYNLACLQPRQLPTQELCSFSLEVLPLLLLSMPEQIPLVIPSILFICSRHTSNWQ